jgi:hypothetical protein
MENCKDDEMFVVDEDHLVGMKEGTRSNPGTSCARERDAEVSFVHFDVLLTVYHYVSQ